MGYFQQPPYQWPGTHVEEREMVVRDMGARNAGKKAREMGAVPMPRPKEEPVGNGDAHMVKLASVEHTVNNVAHIADLYK